MAYAIPSNETRKWVTTNGSDLFGHVVRTKNIDFSKEGYAALARKAMALYTNGDNEDFQTVLSIKTDDSNIYVLTNAGFFFELASQEALTFTDESSGGPNFGYCSDMEFFDGTLHVSGEGTVESFSGGSWTERISSLDTDYPHPLCVSEHQNYLAVGNGNLVNLYSNAYGSPQEACTLPSQYIVTWIRWRNNTLYIGTRHKEGGEAKLFLWNGAGTAAQYGWGAQADWIYSGCEYRGSLAIVTSAGQIKRFNGGGFDEVANFPVYYTPYSWSSSASNDNLVGKVASRGMDAHGDILYINISGELRASAEEPGGTYLPDMPSGLWVFDPEVGLYHKAAPNFSKKLTLTPTAIESNHLVFPSAHKALTGDAVLAVSISGITGLTAGQTYYAVVETGATTAMQLALSPADAKLGNVIALGGTPTTDDFTFDTYQSVGSGQVIRTGGICILGRTVPNGFFGTEILFGADMRTTDLSTEADCLMSLGMGRNVGFFETAKLVSPSVSEAFNKLLIKYGLLHLDSQKIVVKYRTKRRFGFPTQLAFNSNGRATWTSESTFTVDARYRDFKGVEVGDEIEVVGGSGAGYLAHITDISVSGNTYTVTIDETLPVTANDKMDFVADNWKKAAVITNGSADVSDGFASVSYEGKSKWVQFKVELRGFDVDVEQLQIAGATNKKSK